MRSNILLDAIICQKTPILLGLQVACFTVQKRSKTGKYLQVVSSLAKLPSFLAFKLKTLKVMQSNK